jgi:alpha-tubulin suppressor-like RCC1 family protein
MALTESLKVYCWGRNDCGQLGFEENQPLNKATQLNFTKKSGKELKFIQIACGANHSLLLSEKIGFMHLVVMNLDN